MDSHRNYPPDQPDPQWYQPERDYPDPEWDRRGADPRYAPPPGEPQYAEPPAYNDQGQRYGDNPGYGEQDPYRGYQPEGDPRYASPADQAAGLATGRVAPVGPRSGEPLPSLPAGTAMSPEAPVSPGTSHATSFVMPQQAHTASMPRLGPDHGLSREGHPPLAADPHPTADGASLGDGDSQAVRYATESIDRATLRRPAGGPGQLGDGVYRSRRPGTAVALVVIAVVFELVALRLLVAAMSQTPVSVGGSIASAFMVLGMPMFGLGLYGLLSGAAAAPGAGVSVWLRTPLVYLPVALALFLAAGLAAA